MKKRMERALLVMVILIGFSFLLSQFVWPEHMSYIERTTIKKSVNQQMFDNEVSIGKEDDTNKIKINNEHKKNIDNNFDSKKIALTFDDGPHPTYTKQLLDGLRERGVHATFFVTGEHAILHPELITQMHEDGHLIGNHTYSHIQLRKDNRESFKDELVTTNQIIKDITGEDVVYVRPPYGSWDKSFEKELNMFPVLWSVDPLDWCSKDADCVCRRVVEKVSEGDIILLHDYYDSSVTAALLIVEKLQEQGYEFVTVDELLFD